MADRRLVIPVVLAVAVIAASIVFSGDAVRGATELVRSAAAGSRGVGAATLVVALASLFTFLTVLLPLPAEASALLNGSLFNPVMAFWLTWVMAMAGAAASYEIGRRFGHGPAERIFGGPWMARVEGLLDRAGWPTLLALRLSPVMAFTAINWASGILELSRPVFYWTTAVGLVPGTYVFTVAPDILASGAGTTRLVVLALAIMGGLLAMSYLRIRRLRSAQEGPEPTSE